MRFLDVVLNTNRPLAAGEIAELSEMGLRIVAAVGSQSYRMRGQSDATLADLTALSYVANVEEFAPAAKLDKTLKAEAESAAATVAAAGAAALAAQPPARVLVSLDPHADVPATLDALDQIGQVEQSSGRRALVSVDRARLNEVASLPGVLAAEVEPDPRTQNNVARALTNVAPVAPTLGLDGSGEIVGVADSGLDNGVNDATMLSDFAGRIVNIRATVNKAALGVADGADLNNHGTHVSGSILGDGSNSNGNLAGMAPAAHITMLSMGPNNSTGLSVPLDLTSGVFQDAYDDGARLHNNSWGSNGSAGAYSAFSSDVDEFMRDNPDMLVIFAAGNEGNGAGSVTAPGTAKNCLTVGASESVRPLPSTLSINPNFQDDDFNPATPDNNVPLSLSNFNLQADDAEDIAVFSGRGPTDDGRIKPDIVAPGTFILSCRSQVSTADVGPDGMAHVGNLATFYADDADGVATHAEAVGRGLPGAPFYGAWNQNTPAAPAGSGPNAQQNYFYNSGTSMATPITTGTTALLRQYLRQQRGVTNPSAALIKALLVNGATVPAGASNAPDNTRGFGWLNLENTLTPAPTGQQTYSDDVDLAVATNDVRNFSVQIADTGHPLRVTLTWTDAPGSGLQNRLYLRVVAPDGTATDGDVTPFPNAGNNVQRVHIDSPMAGTYTVQVHGVSVLFGIDAHLPAIRQDFALAIINGIGFSPEPVDVVQVLDKSGSMDFYGFIGPARARAKQFVDMLRVNDRTGVVTFDGTAATVHPVVQIGGFATQDAIKANIDAIAAGGVTSIGGGLDQARAELATGGDPAHPQAMVLLSDGHENRPPWVGGGVTDSPPGWYGGPDLAEVLPTISPGIKIYTVSLGVQSDQVLLQEIASATGGVFHAIHSLADVHKLHEIYIHLQALTGGEEVIASGNSSVDGLSIGIAGAGAAVGAVDGASGADGAILAELQGLANVSAQFPDPSFLLRFVSTRVHRIQVDETLSTLTLMVSWHDPELPVSLSLITPSQRVIKPGSPVIFNRSGSSYQFFRIDEPEPGEWQMVVRSQRRDGAPRFATHAYTYGAYGKTPLGIRAHLPKKLAGAPSLKLHASLAGLDQAARTVRFVTTLRTPRLSVDELLEKHHQALDQLDLAFEPDNPELDPNLFKLAALDRALQKEGKRTLFGLRHRRLHLTRNNDYTDALETPVAGLYPLHLVAVGTSAEGFRYRRQMNFDVRI
ncbi:MAG: S8 family serine peptidase [Anaerolineae bacterium]|jgi:Mg-chelatase subunit ChlD/subtilisin family serine protease